MTTNHRLCSVASARTIQRGSFDLPLAPSAAFDLFTAEGEKRWVDGWDPIVLGAGDCTEPGTVFLTNHDGEQTIWTVIEADRDAGRLRYSRVSPGRRAGTVGVHLSAIDGGSRIIVSYDLTALGPEGEAAIMAMDAAAYSLMLSGWRSQILAIPNSAPTLGRLPDVAAPDMAPGDDQPEQ
jgi:hypothetical protein